MMDILTTFERALSSCGHLTHGSPIVIGVSGGADSLVLLHLFVQARKRHGWELHVLHVNHQIRGSDAEADARFVESVAAEWDVPCTVEQFNVPAIAQARRLSLEEAARQARYTALGRKAVALGTQVIAVAHNADDQAETVLMHLMRGAGLLGLRGMLPATPLSDYHLLEPLNAPLQLVRPLLSISRADIEAYCIEHGFLPRFDQSNLDKTYFRNRLRHEIIPVLETVNPNIRTMLTQTASILAAYYDAIKPAIDATWDSITRDISSNHIVIDLAAWRALPLAFQRAAVRRAVWHLRQASRDTSFQHVEDAVNIARSGETGAQATLPGELVMRIEYDALVFSGADVRPPRPDWPFLPPGSSIRVNGQEQIPIPGSDWCFSLFPYDGPRSGPTWDALLSDPWTTPLNAEALRPPITLRTRQPGDRFFPLGLGSTQKISAFMINEKIPASWRENIPLLVAGNQIVWLAGWRVDERFAVKENTRTIWLASFTTAADD
jgi:tRNA(Ile)-lysidine synthetase-like protein